MSDIFERMRIGEPINMADTEEYRADAHREMDRCRRQCFEINSAMPGTEEIRILEGELFSGSLPETSFLTPPFQIDYANQMTIGEHVFANHGFTCMSGGGITIGDGTMIGPDAALLTVNHDLNDLQVLIFKGITIGKGAWIGARAIILPGVTIGDGAVVGSGSVVTHNVPANMVVAGNPARPLRMIERKERVERDSAGSCLERSLT